LKLRPSSRRDRLYTHRPAVFLRIAKLEVNGAGLPLGRGENDRG